MTLKIAKIIKPCHWIIAVFLFTCSLLAQEFVVPESSAFDVKTGRYFISNFGNGDIVEMDSTGERSVFKTGLSKSLGMVIHEDVLYVINGLRWVRGFRLSDALETFSIQIEEAVFLNDITCDDRRGFLYVTDSNSQAVYKIDIVNCAYHLFVKTLLDNPNGIVYEPANDRLVLCYFRENSEIGQISLADSALTTLIKPGLHNLDGIGLDSSGNFFISSWGPGSFKTGFGEGAIYKFGPSFKLQPEKVATGLRGPADIYYSRTKNELIIPLFLENDVKIVKMKH